MPGGGPPGPAQIQENLLSLEEVVKQLEVCLGPGDLGQAAEGKAFLIYGPLQELEEEFCRLRSLLSQLSGILSPSLAVPERSVQTSESGTGARIPCSTVPSVSVHPSLPLLSQPLSSISSYLLLVTLRPFVKRPPAAATASHTPEALRRGRLATLDRGPAGVPASHTGLCLSPSCLCFGGSGLHPQSTTIIPIFQAISVLPMGGLPLHSPTPSAFALFLYPEWRFIFNIYYLRRCLCA